MTAAATGDQAPNFKATLVDGTKFQLSDLGGHYVLLDFGVLGVALVEEKTQTWFNFIRSIKVKLRLFQLPWKRTMIIGRTQ